MAQKLKSPIGMKALEEWELTDSEAALIRRVLDPKDSFGKPTPPSVWYVWLAACGLVILLGFLIAKGML